MIQAPKIILPAPDQKQLRCRCGHMDFGGHIQPLDRGGAVVTELICRRCQHVLKLRPADMSLERTGVVTDMKGNRCDG